MVEMIVIVKRDGKIVEIPTPSDAVLAFKTKFGTIEEDRTRAYHIEQSELRKRGLCTTCGEHAVYEDLDMCESCRNKVKAMWCGLKDAMNTYNGSSHDVNWKCRRTWESSREYNERVWQH